MLLSVLLYGLTTELPVYVKDPVSTSLVVSAAPDPILRVNLKEALLSRVKVMPSNVLGRTVSGEPSEPLPPPPHWVNERQQATIAMVDTSFFIGDRWIVIPGTKSWACLGTAERLPTIPRLRQFFFNSSGILPSAPGSSGISLSNIEPPTISRCRIGRRSHRGDPRYRLFRGFRRGHRGLRGGRWRRVPGRNLCP